MREDFHRLRLPVYRRLENTNPRWDLCYEEGAAGDHRCLTGNKELRLCMAIQQWRVGRSFGGVFHSLFHLLYGTSDANDHTSTDNGMSNM